MGLIVGLDIATSTGVAVLDSNRELVSYTIIKLNSKEEYRLRFRYFRQELLKLFDEFKPEKVILEGVYSGPNVVTTAYLNNLRGIAIESVPCYSEFISVYPSSARKIVLGKGRVSKQEVFKYIKTLYKLSDFKYTKHNDITDAIVLVLSKIVD